MRQIVKKIGQSKFRVFWNEQRNSELIMDFKPIINQFNLTGNFVLLHWQALPKYLRRWGMFCSASDDYYPFNHDQLKVIANRNFSTLQIDEAKWGTKPTAVILVQDVSVSVDSENQEYIIE
jgi:hypothetical protein